MNVGEFAMYEGCYELLGYGEHDRTDVEEWIRETWHKPVDAMVARYKIVSSKFKGFKKIYKKHGLPYVCRHLDINSSEYHKFVEVYHLRN